jgi:hypothetical protein
LSCVGVGVVLPEVRAHENGRSRAVVVHDVRRVRFMVEGS